MSAKMALDVFVALANGHQIVSGRQDTLDIDTFGTMESRDEIAGSEGGQSDKSGAESAPFPVARFGDFF